jgi:hypothetical protein
MFLQQHYSMSATEIFLVSDIECLSQNMRFLADTCNIEIFPCPMCISGPHNTGHYIRLPYKKDRGNYAISEVKKVLEIARCFLLGYIRIFRQLT